ncbi:hypothetical protein CYMTET_51313 [Cymbomonas tetramitiformis]|uniref:Uncharacterized protein n=1 Tax=Cymbomonas tetramitiformis TaxID=36881 RepID=A0AAE0BMH9_9CHLO|nr:hypothetical protein CYMTET_51313 [Cymbomonas tetramitiformis]
MRGARSRHLGHENQMALDEIDTCADPIMREKRLAAQGRGAPAAPRARPQQNRRPPAPELAEPPAPNPPFRREPVARVRRQADIRQGEINDRSIYTTRQSGVDIFDELHFKFDFTSTPEDSYFEPWPTTIEGAKALCREEGNKFTTEADARAYAGWRYCVVDGGYVGLIVNFKENLRKQADSLLELDFGFYMDHREHIARPCARFSAYNALRHLSARDLQKGATIQQYEGFVVAQRRIVALLLLHNLLAARRKYNLHDRSKYRAGENGDSQALRDVTRGWFGDAQNGLVARTEMSATDVVERIHLAVIAARECVHPEIRGILTRAPADETLDDLNMLDASAACLPPKLTFGFSRVRTGTQKVTDLRQDMLRSDQFEIFGARLTPEIIAEQRGFRNAVPNDDNRRMQYEMTIDGITQNVQPNGQNGRRRHEFYTNEAHEMTFVRIMCGDDNAVFDNVLNPRCRYSTVDASNGPNVFALNRVPTGRYVDALCLPMEADQFGLQQEIDAQGRARCRYTFAPNYLQDAFPIPEPMPSIQVAPRLFLTQDYETRMENTLETLCHVFAANTHAAVRAFMQHRGHLIFSDVLRNGRNAPGAHGDLKWDVVGAEYPIYNPHAMFTGTETQKPYPLLYETRADAVLHAHYPDSSNTVLKTGRVIMVEYKDVMEVKSPAGRIMDYRSIYQCLCNAYLFFMDVGVLPTHALVVHATRRAVYKDRDYNVNQGRNTHSAYVSLLRVDISSRMQMRLFQRILTNPLNFRMRVGLYDGRDEVGAPARPTRVSNEGETVYMDDGVYLFDANIVRTNPNWFPCIGEPNEDMPAVKAKDDPRRPNFAVTRACVALHERAKHMWHPPGREVDTDTRVRPQQYNRARDPSLMSRFMAYDSVLQHPCHLIKEEGFSHLPGPPLTPATSIWRTAHF